MSWSTQGEHNTKPKGGVALELGWQRTNNEKNLVYAARQLI
jgi:hypothetical protein